MRGVRALRLHLRHLGRVLAAKNAILIVEFARQAEARGATSVEAVVQAARLRLRPILMTSLAFVLGVVPLLVSSGAGAEMRRTLGTTVFFGMLGVTAFGLVFTPVFYVAVQRLFGRRPAPAARALPDGRLAPPRPGRTGSQSNSPSA